MDFVVIRARQDEHDPVALAKILASVRGTPVQDQMIEARAAWGILGEGLTEEEARALATTLRSEGVSCAVGPTRGLASLPEAESATAREQLPEAAPFFVAAAGLTITGTTTIHEAKGASPGAQIAKAALLATGIPVGIVGGKKKPVERTERTEDLVFFADLHYEDPRRRIRISASDFNFSCLGGRMLYHPQGNLKLLLGDIVADAPDALQNHGARVLLEGKPIRTMGYGSLEDLEREERWLLTLRRMGQRKGD